MTEESKIVQNSLLKLEHWSGSKTISRALDEFLDLEIYLVGGVIRDEVLKKPSSPKDFDFILTGSDLDKFIPWIARDGKLTKGQFLSPRWFPNNDKYTYCDLMDIRSWDAGVGQCNSIQDILKQFDFTGNSLAVSLREKKLVNPCHGYEDLLNKTLRATRLDFPDQAIRSDTTLTKMAIHWFRYIYYAETLNLHMEEKTLEWIKSNSKFKQQINEYCREFFKEKEYIEIITSAFK